LGFWAEGREANFVQVPRLMLGTFTAPKISMAHFQPTFFMSSHSLSWQNPWGGRGGRGLSSASMEIKSGLTQLNIQVTISIKQLSKIGE
jgi:hypothetical protein